MSIESDLSSIAQSLKTIADAMIQRTAVSYEVKAAAPIAAAVAAPVAALVATPVAAPAVTISAVAAPAPVAAPMVAPAMFAPTAMPAAVTGVYADHAAMLAAVMASYKALGPIKGAKIQDILTSVGVVNINEVKPEHYAAIQAGLAALSA